MIKKYFSGDNLEMELLIRLGNRRPSIMQCDLMRKLVSQVSINHRLCFDEQLTQQEKNCLFYVAHGYSSKEMAELLECEASTIRYYRQEILRKLNCNNMAQATFMGMRYGYLDGYVNESKVSEDEKELDLTVKRRGESLPDLT